METTTTLTRDRVARSYARALESATKGSGSSCCGPTSCSSPAVSDQHADVPSFGCGDPLLFANVELGATVLDLGSGAGYDLIAAAERVGPEGLVIGVDMTDEMVEAAKRNVAAAGLDNVEVRKGLIENLPVESGSVDWVISNCVINLSPDKDRVFREIARVLRPGGRFSVSDICAENLPASIRRNEAAYDGCIAGAISERDFLQGLREAGLAKLLAEAKVRYDSPELEALAKDALDRARCGSEIDLTGEFGGVWSIRFTGQKPG